MLQIIQYKPGERQKWQAIEERIFCQLKDRFSIHNNLFVAIDEVQPGLRIIKNKMKACDHHKLIHHAENAGRRFLQYCQVEGVNVRIPKKSGIIRISDFGITGG